ncbi:TPA: hypothetical protein ACV5C1_005082, partial [Escherichia coli]
TEQIHGFVFRAPVFPAPAGINRIAIVHRFAKTGVPRASGDKPEPDETTEAVLSSSPRQRG